MEALELLKNVWRRKWLILTVTALSGLAALLFTITIPETYRSTAQLATGITDNSALSLDEGENANNFYAANNKFSNLIEDLTSRQIISLLSYQLILHDLSEKPFRDLSDIRSNYSNAALKEAERIFENKLDSIQVLTTMHPKEELLINLLKEVGYDYESLKSQIFVERIPSTDYVRIACDTEHPLLSSYAVNELADQFIRYYVLVRGERSNNSLRLLAELAEEQKRDLEEKVNALKEYKSSNQVVNLNLQSESIIQQIRDLEVKREEERKKVIGLTRVISNIDRQLTNREVSYLTNQATIINQRIFTLKQKINELNEKRVTVANTNPELVRRLDELREELQLQIKSYTAENINSPAVARQELINNKINSEVELEIAQASIESFTNEINRLQGNISGFASKEAQISAIDREISLAQEEYMNTIDKLNSARLSSRNVGSSLRQVEFGYPADEPIRSNKLLIVALVMAITFSLSVISLIMLEYFDTTPRSLAVLEKITALPSLGYLNQLKFKPTIELLFSDVPKKDLILFKEQLRKIRSEIMQVPQSKTLLFTSLKANEGKTTTVISLAYALSLAQKKVLIIDANFKNNQITTLFFANKNLEKLHHMPTDAKNIISGTGFKGINVLGCEGGSHSPYEIFTNTEFTNALSSLQEAYDYVLIECAHLDQYADARELQSFVDKMIVVFSAQNPISQADNDSIAYLRGLDKGLLGVILNKVTANQS